MDKREIEELRDRVSCAAVVTDVGFELDTRESTRRALKFRRGGEIVIVTHGGAGWFDPLSDEKGDVFALAIFLGNVSFAAATAKMIKLLVHGFGMLVAAPTIGMTTFRNDAASEADLILSFQPSPKFCSRPRRVGGMFQAPLLILGGNATIS